MVHGFPTLGVNYWLFHIGSFLDNNYETVILI